ncbi:MAG: RsmE family RNA methyltransferase [bacterium]|nr:RsmE family RNA methyltransferase [bacterium]MDT8396090.1 RsmE family RNA methyltransferase [bacterium]
MSLPTFYINPSGIAEGSAILDGDELRHARTTLRLKPDDKARIVDGEGTLYEARFRTMGKDEAVLDIVSSTKEPAPAFSLTVAMGVVQGDRFDWALQKGTELGVTRFIPLLTERTDIRPGAQWKRLPRLKRVIASACKQCGRAQFPSITEPTAIENLGVSYYDRAVLFWEEEGRSLALDASDVKRPGSCLMIIGPVGGLTASEAEMLKGKGAIAAGLGPRVLRTETAVTAGVTLLQYLWGDLGS